MNGHYENKSEGYPKSGIILICGIIGMIVLVSIMLSVFYGENEYKTVKAQGNKGVIEKGLIAGIDSSDPIIFLEHFQNGSSLIYTAISETGRAVAFDNSWKILAEGDNPPVNLTTELPKFLTSLIPLKNESPSQKFLGGTMDGKFNLYKIQDQRLVVQQEIADFRDPSIGDAIAGAGSITHILVNKNRSRAVALNFDGKGRIFSVENDTIRDFGSFQLTSAAIDGDFVGDEEIWIVGADGHIYVYNLNNPAKPGLEFNVADFGRITGADYRNGKFLVYGHSLAVKTAAITVYDKTGRFVQTLTRKSIDEKPIEQPGFEQNSISELPQISDLGESFAAAEWQNQESVLAAAENKIYLLNTVSKKIRVFDLPLIPGERVTRFNQTEKNTVIVGTSSGRVFETKLEI